MSWRKISVNDVEWRFKIGKQNVVARNAETGKSKVINFHHLTGLSWNEIDRGKWKGWFSITPKQIANWLNNQ